MPKKGYKQTPEHRQRVSQSKRGVPHRTPRSDEHCRKLSEAVKRQGGIKEGYKYTNRSKRREKDWQTRKRPTAILRSPWGTLHRVRHQRKWCQKHGLSTSALCRLIRDAMDDKPKYQAFRQAHHKGWTCVRVVKHRRKQL